MDASIIIYKTELERRNKEMKKAALVDWEKEAVEKEGTRYADHIRADLEIVDDSDGEVTLMISTDFGFLTFALTGREILRLLKSFGRIRKELEQAFDKQ